MENLGLKKRVIKLIRDITDLKKQIESINNDIKNGKEQSYIKKRIKRLKNKYNEIYKKYEEISSKLDKEVVDKIYSDLKKIEKEIELLQVTSHKNKGEDNKKEKKKKERKKERRKKKNSGQISNGNNPVEENKKEEKNEENSGQVLSDNNLVGEQYMEKLVNSFWSKNKRVEEYKVKGEKGEKAIKIKVYREDGTLEKEITRYYKSNGKVEEVFKLYEKDGQLKFVNLNIVPEGFWDKVKKLITKTKKEGFFESIGDKIKGSIKKIFNNKMKKRLAALGMGALMLLPIAKTMSEQHSATESKNNKSNYTDKVKDDHQLYEKKLVISAVENTWKSYKISRNELEKESHIIAPAGCKYTAVSDGSGEYGIFSKDTEVKIFNRALIRYNKDGSKSILKATEVGQTWEQYAKEQGIDYKDFKEYIDNNKNIEKVVSIMPVDGENPYGWVSDSDLVFKYRTQSENIGVEENCEQELGER